MSRHTLPLIPFVLSIFCLAVPAQAGPEGGCVPGVYLVKESSGTQSLWTFSGDGTIHTTSSAQGALQFGDGQGEWKKARGKQVKSTVLDFSYSPSPVGSGFPPASIARVDAVSSFSRDCKDIHGSFELRFFDAQTEDALDPATDTGSPLAETFTGRRVSSR